MKQLLDNMAQLPNQNEAKDYVIQEVTSFYEEYGWNVPPIQFPAFPNDFEQIDLHQFLLDWTNGHSISQELLDYSNNLIDLLLTNSTLNQFSIESMALLSSASSILNQEDLQILTDAVDIANQSISFWTGQYSNSHNWTAGLIIPPPQPPIMIGMNWWKVAGCDAVGGIGGAIIGAGNPVSIGVGAAVCSACNIINQW
ncbi:MAG: hypothetical protein KDC83_14790 [Flavobacteriales bacterium]|nr:hypothetical protein [Flavobacteriales bacterium]